MPRSSIKAKKRSPCARSGSLACDLAVPRLITAVADIAVDFGCVHLHVKSLVAAVTRSEDTGKCWLASEIHPRRNGERRYRKVLGIRDLNVIAFLAYEV